MGSDGDRTSTMRGILGPFQIKNLVEQYQQSLNETSNGGYLMQSKPLYILRYEATWGIIPKYDYPEEYADPAQRRKQTKSGMKIALD